MGTISPIVMMAGVAQPQMLGYFFGAYLILGVVASLGAVAFEKKKKGKAEDFSEELSENAASAEGVADAQQRARMDDMRKEFERGIGIYKQYGKDIYSLPWFVVVGESGSGKTEAIRNSDIGFPDKLQDYWQGSGGTLSMHWWFTNKAVILDTAGRLFVQDGQSVKDKDNQWTEFLQMLRKNRPECPINGLVLVIPSTSLIPLTDSAAEQESITAIDARAGQISRQLEVLQKELTIRFPVYLLITKTDRIVGFRDFFSDVEKPEERHQMLGWSNPNKLNDRFDPASITRHLRQTAERFRKRRMALLKDPVPTDGAGKRVDQVDGLYAFPNAFENLAPKLERYLRHIFSTDEWSANPPFLRGLYFSSALQEGTVLDESIASALGLSVDDYEQRQNSGLTVAKNKSYFLRDLFNEKVFSEKGLVLKTGKKATAFSGWKLWLPVGLVTALLVTGLIGWLTSIKAPPEIAAWKVLSQDAYLTDKATGFAPLLVRNSRDEWVFTKKPVTAGHLLETLGDLSTLVKSGPKLGWLYAPAAALDGGVKSDRKAAHKIAVDGVIVTPLIEAALSDLLESSEKWNSENISRSDRAALAALLTIQSDRKKANLEADIKTLFASIDQPLPTSRDRYEEITLPLFAAIKSAYPSGKISKKILQKKDTQQLLTILERLSQSSAGEDPSKILIAFDQNWKELSQLTPETPAKEARTTLASVKQSSKALSIAEPRLKGFSANSSSDEDSSKEDKTTTGFIKNLLEEHERTLKSLSPGLARKFEQALEKPKIDNEEEIEGLINLHLQKMAGKELSRHQEITQIAEALLELPDQLGNPRKLPSVNQFIFKIDDAFERADAAEIADTAQSLFSISLNKYLSETLAAELAFPLVFENVTEGKVLTTSEAASLSLLCARLAEYSPSAEKKLSKVNTVAESLFDIDKLKEEGISSPRNWQITLQVTPPSIDFTRVVLASTGRRNCEWTYEERTEPRDLPVDSGATVSISDRLGGSHNFTSGNCDDWAPVRWAFVQTRGDRRVDAQGQLGQSKFQLKTSPLQGFPKTSTDLPKRTDLR